MKKSTLPSIVSFLLLFFLLLVSSCAKRPRPNVQKSIEKHLVQDHRKINFANQNNSIKINYTGCGGFLLQKDSSAIFIDPYFSNVGPLPLVFLKKLKTDTTLISQFFEESFGDKQDIDGIIKFILIAHSHYDHLADAPYIYQEHCNQDSTTIVGSKTTKYICQGAGTPCQVIAQEKTTITESVKNDFIYSKNGQIRILPIPSEHAPHFLGMSLIPNKELEQGLTEYPKKILKFPEGENYNFLIDFLDEEGEISFRIFSNAGSACNSGVGFPPAEVLAEKEVDVLLLCVASYKQVEGYPDELIEYIKPKHIVLNHWENFFKPIQKLQEKPAAVPATNVKKFIKNLEQTWGDSTDFSLPLPLTELTFYY